MIARLALVALLLGGCGSARTTFAAHPAAAPAFDRAASDPKALEIADRVIAAAGGMAAWNAAREIRWSGSIAEAGQPPFTFDEAWDRWNGRHRYRGAGSNVLVMRDIYGTRQIVFGDPDHARVKLSGADADRALASARERWELDTAVLFLPFLLEAPGHKVVLAGEFPGPDGGAPLDDLKLTFDPRDPNRTATYHVMVNRTTSQIERIEIVKAGDPDNRRAAYKPGAWIDAGGLKLATTYQNIGLPTEVITYSGITVHAEPDDELYVPVAQ